MTTWGSEAELAKAVIVYLKGFHYEIYQEVVLGSSRADIVAVQKPILMVVETKKTLTFDVIAQAAPWREYAHRVFIAVPDAKWSAGRAMAFKVCRDAGIGVLLVSKGYEHIAVTEQVPALLRRRIEPSLFMELREEQKTYAEAGSNKGGYYTPFRGTCEALKRAVEENSGATLKEIIDGLEHHYATPSSARNHLGSWIEAGKIPGVEIRREDGKVRVYLTDVRPEPKARDRKKRAARKEGV